MKSSLRPLWITLAFFIHEDRQGGEGVPLLSSDVREQVIVENRISPDLEVKIVCSWFILF